MKIKTRKIKVGQLINQTLTLPIIEIGEGKTVIGIVGGIHGNEPESLFIMRELIKKLRGQKLKKRVRFLPGANPMALINNTRVGAFDAVDLNRAFPGSKNGTLTQQIAAAIFENFSDCEMVIDIHSVTNVGVLMGMELSGGGPKLLKQTKEVNRLLNPVAIWRAVEGAKYASAMDESFLQAGILGVGVEVPRLEFIDESLMKRIVDGLLAVVLGEKSTKLAKPIPVLEGAMRYFSEFGGLYNPVMKVLSPIKKGDVVGVITDLTTMRDKKLISTFEGVLFVQSSRKLVKTGDKIFVVINKIGDFQ